MGKRYDTLRTTFSRWETEGYAGLAEHVEQQGQNPLITNAIKTFMEEKLSEDRTWTCEHLSRALAEKHNVKVGPEGVRVRLKEMGYGWKDAS